jgi:hypothetical protein
MAAEPSADGRDAFQEAHRELLSDRALQFDLPVEAPRAPPKPPAWLEALVDFLGAIAPLLGWIFWIGAIALAALIIFFVIRETLGGRFERFRFKRRAPRSEAGQPTEWRPTETAARVLLADADRLAAEGRFAEAVHLLLLRSIEDLHGRRPRAVRPALTARDIAALEALPASARPAFRSIAEVVERSLFGGAAVDAAAFARCRASYEDFAFPGGWRE